DRPRSRQPALNPKVEGSSPSRPIPATAAKPSWLNKLVEGVSVGWQAWKGRPHGRPRSKGQSTESPRAEGTGGDVQSFASGEPVGADGGRAGRAGGAGFRSVFASASGADHLSRHADRRPDRQPDHCRAVAPRV